MKHIACGYRNGQVIRAIIDAEDFDDLAQYNWGLKIIRNGPTMYAIRSYTEDGQEIRLFMHHQIIGLPKLGWVVDHINRNSLDNRKENLRFATTRENSANTDRHKEFVHEIKSGFRTAMLFRTREHAEGAAKLLKAYRDSLNEDN